MQLALTRTQSLILLATVVVLLAVGFFPTFGAPEFRYTGSDPDRHVWNLGWPLATCILDTDTSPYLFVDPCLYLWLIALVGSVLVIALCMIGWNNRASLRLRRRSPAGHRST